MLPDPHTVEGLRRPSPDHTSLSLARLAQGLRPLHRPLPQPEILDPPLGAPTLWKSWLRLCSVRHLCFMFAVYRTSQADGCWARSRSPQSRWILLIIILCCWFNDAAEDENKSYAVHVALWCRPNPCGLIRRKRRRFLSDLIKEHETATRNVVPVTFPTVEISLREWEIEAGKVLIKLTHLTRKQKNIVAGSAEAHLIPSVGLWPGIIVWIGRLETGKYTQYTTKFGQMAGSVNSQCTGQYFSNHGNRGLFLRRSRRYSASIPVTVIAPVLTDMIDRGGVPCNIISLHFQRNISS